MARTVTEIFNSMVAEKERQPALSALTSTSATAVWRLVLYVVAFCTNVLEQLFDGYKLEVDAKVEELTPHRAKWYRDKVLDFMANKTLVADTDRYDTTGMGEDEIEAAHVVRHAVAEETLYTSFLIIKVAGEQDGVRCKITDEEQTQLEAYLTEIKDAGVRITLVNSDPDLFRCEADIYYDAMRLPDEVRADCEAAIKDYIENLPFNGEYTNMALVDVLQQIDGVKIAEFRNASSAKASDPGAFSGINAKVVPAAGYFKADNIRLNMIAYELQREL